LRQVLILCRCAHRQPRFSFVPDMGCISKGYVPGRGERSCGRIVFPVHDREDGRSGKSKIFWGSLSCLHEKDKDVYSVSCLKLHGKLLLDFS